MRAPPDSPMGRLKGVVLIHGRHFGGDPRSVAGSARLKPMARINLATNRFLNPILETVQLRLKEGGGGGSEVFESALARPNNYI